jgi:hypothetical protein
MRSSTVVLAFCLVACAVFWGCTGELGSGAADSGVNPPTKDSAVKDGAVKDSAVKDGAVKDGAAKDGAVKPPGDSAVPPPPTKPMQLAPCKAPGKCWSAPALSALCGTVTQTEDYSSGKYNVHRYSLSPKPGVKVTLTLETTAGGYKPALVLADQTGATVYDGATGLVNAALNVVPLNSGKGTLGAKVRLTASKATNLQVHATGWSVINSGFAAPLPKSAKYKLTVHSGCPPPKPGQLLSPPNFDAKNKVKGYYLLPQSKPPGLYTRKADACSRGTKLLIDVLYTVAVRWKQKWPSLSPIAFLDLNEGSCSSVNHATHDDGTHADLTAGCATQVACTNNQPAIDLAKLFVDTGQVCGIINNDTAVQKSVNAYFSGKFSYKPWHGTFMRSVSGHTHHFHVRVKKPDGTCN